MSTYVKCESASGRFQQGECPLVGAFSGHCETSRKFVDSSIVPSAAWSPPSPRSGGSSYLVTAHWSPQHTAQDK